MKILSFTHPHVIPNLGLYFSVEHKRSIEKCLNTLLILSMHRKSLGAKTTSVLLCIDAQYSMYSKKKQKKKTPLNP